MKNTFDIDLRAGSHADWHWYPGEIERVEVIGAHKDGKRLIIRPLTEEAHYLDEPHSLRPVREEAP